MADCNFFSSPNLVKMVVKEYQWTNHRHQEKMNGDIAVWMQVNEQSRDELFASYGDWQNSHHSIIFSVVTRLHNDFESLVTMEDRER